MGKVAMKPIEVTDLELAFPAHVQRLMPENLAKIHADADYDPRWAHFADTWFARGADAALLHPRPGIDKTKALRHLKCIMGSYEPKHEHKMSAVAYLLGLWFEKGKGG